MIEAGAVGAVFTVVDEATGVLTRIAQQFERLDALILRTKDMLATFAAPGLTEAGAQVSGLNRSLTGLNDRLTRAGNLSAWTGNELVAGFGRAEGAATESFGVIDGSIDGAIKRIQALKTELSSMPAASAEAAAMVPALASGSGGRGSPPGMRARGTGAEDEGARISRYGGIPLGKTGYHVHGGSPAAMGAAAALGYGIYEEAEVESLIAKAMLTGQIKVDAGMTDTTAFKQMRDVIQRVSGDTGFGPLDVGKALLTTERQFGGMSFADRLKIEETLIPFAAAEARMKETSLPEAFEAMVGLSHMTGTYDPKQLPELMRQFSYASMITPVPIPQFQKALSYSLPMLHAGLDMDPSAVMFLTAMTQTAGVTNTKSGTWLRSFFENAEPKIGDHLSKGAIEHNEALQRMGLLDAKNDVTWQVKDAAGKTDWDQSIVKMSEAINKFTQATDPATRLSTLRTAFGERGGGEASLMNMTQFIDQFPILQAKMKAFLGGDNILGALNNTTAQKADVAWAQTQNVLMDLGQTTLPIINAALNAFNATLKLIQNTLGQNTANPLIGGAALAVVAARLKPGLLTGIAGMLSSPLALTAGAIGGGLYAASYLSSPQVARELAIPSPVDVEHKRINDALNPTAAAVSNATRALEVAARSPVPSMPADPLFHPGRDVRSPSTGPYSYTPASLAPNIQGSLQMLPGQVQPAITSAFASIGSAISSAIAGMASSARAAAGAIQTGSHPIAVTVQSTMNADGRKIAEVVSSHQIAANRSVNNSAAADTTSLPGWPDMQAYA